jgi:UDP-glucose 4-epimerase
MCLEVVEAGGSQMKVLITGVSGKLGRLVARSLLEQGHTIYGLDRRPWPDAPRGVEMYNADVRKRPAEDVVRSKRPDAIIHMATVTHFSARPEERYRINLKGTQAVFEYCDRYGIEQVVFVGRHTYYGAASDTALYHSEDDPPLAVSTFPELSDLVASDLYAGSALWRYPEVCTSVLRMCYTLGPGKHGTLAQYLRGPRVATVLGFDPLYQFMHEEDAARAICASLTNKLRGVYNVAGPQPVPLSLLIRVTGRTNVTIPEPLFYRMLGHFGLPQLPPGAINHVKHPVVVDHAAFRAATGFVPTFDEVQTMESFRWAE